MSGPGVAGLRQGAGSFDQALEDGRRLLGDRPSDALDQALALLAVNRDARALRLAGAALRRLGRRAEAEDAELAALQEGLKDERHQAAARSHSEGDYHGALRIAGSILRDDPNDLLAATLAGETLIALWDLDRAEVALQRVIERAPDFLRASMLLATCLARQARIDEATKVLGEMVKRKPGHEDLLNYLGQLLSESGDIEGAVAVCERLCAANPSDPKHQVLLAQHYRMAGHADAAVAAFRRALEIDPTHGSAWWGLVNYYPREITPEDRTAIEAALQSSSESASLGSLHLALALILDRAGDHEKAFPLFVEGKAIRLAKQPFDSERAYIDAVIDTVVEKLAAGPAASGFPDDSPIFIVGMPRSGSTLMAEILGQHSAIENAGELPILPRLSERLRQRSGSGTAYAEALAAMTADDVAALGERYVTAARAYRHEDKPFFIDKLNLNWLHSALIRLALPNARIIDVRRDALDCCWSNFKMLFAAGNPAANDLRHIGRFYREYVAMMDAVGQASPGAILTVCYEDLVEDAERETRRVLEFLGLPFEPQCLEFHSSRKAVATASSEQVRQPINRKGIGAADPYRQWLGPLIEELGELAR